MKAIQGYHLIKPEDLFWRPSNPMKIPNADYLERTGSENLGARLWRRAPIAIGVAPGVQRHRRRSALAYRGRAEELEFLQGSKSQMDLSLIYPVDPIQLPKELAGVEWPPKI